MKHSKLAAAMAAATVALAVAGCGGGGGSHGDASAPPAPPPTTGMTPTDFTAFTHAQLLPSATTETATPFEIETVEWAFPDGESATAFDDVIASSP